MSDTKELPAEPAEPAPPPLEDDALFGLSDCLFVSSSIQGQLAHYDFRQLEALFLGLKGNLCAVKVCAAVWQCV